MAVERPHTFKFDLYTDAGYREGRSTVWAANEADGLKKVRAEYAKGPNYRIGFICLVHVDYRSKRIVE